MVTMVVSTVLALASAAAVLAVAGAAGGRGEGSGARTSLGDVRAGLRTWRSERRGEAGPAAGPEPVDTSIEDFLAATAVEDPAYLGVDDLTETLTRARDRATHRVGGLRRR